jgi:ketosteroid isomerase-like protein
MTFDPVAAITAYHAALNAHDVDLVETLMAENAQYVSAGLGVVNGRVAIVAAMRSYFANYKDHKSWDEHVEATGAHSAHCTWRLTATEGKSGKSIARLGTEEVTFDGDALVLKVHVTDAGTTQE